MDKRILREVQLRGEQLGRFLCGGGDCEVGTGMSPIASIGMPINQNSLDKSNLSSIISMEKYLQTPEPQALETARAWTEIYPTNEKAAMVWLYHYRRHGENQRDNGKPLSTRHLATEIKISQTQYLKFMSAAEHMLAIKLELARRAA
ncbi:MAG: hypothetical protein OQK12_16805 [Motiliproteus sp.]|nr:hypothetical protein [Motiliproteus sp.]MCW9051250.1 hypothetical protein [Motiliproteus sp.]